MKTIKKTPKEEIKNLPAGANTLVSGGIEYAFFSYSFRREGKPCCERDYIGTVKNGEFAPNLYYVTEAPSKKNRPSVRWKDPTQRALAEQKEAQDAQDEALRKGDLDLDMDPKNEPDLCVGVTALAVAMLYDSGMVADVGEVLDGNVFDTMGVINLGVHAAITAKPTYLAAAESKIQRYIGTGCLSSPRASELHQRVGSIPKLSLKISTARVKRLEDRPTVALDGTKIDCDSMKIGPAAFGRDKDGNPNKQISYSSCVNVLDGDMIGYRWFAGNFADVATLYDFRNIWHDIGLKDKRPMLIMDRGYYKQEEMIRLHDEGYEYLVGAKIGIKVLKNVLEERNSEFYSALNCIRGHGCYGLKQEVVIKSAKGKKANVYAYVYRDPTIECKETENLFNALDKLENDWIIHKAARDDELLQYYQPNPDPRLPLVRNDKLIEQDCYLKGFFGFVSNRDMERTAALDTYDLRNEVEVVFGLMFKHLMHSTRVQSTQALEGLFFTTFVGLNVLTRMREAMKNPLSTGKMINERYTIEELFKVFQQISLTTDRHGNHRFVGLTSIHTDLVARLGYPGLFDDPEAVAKLLSAKHLADTIKTV